MPHRRADELTYYDDLGIGPNASPDEVRESFRALVRLIHPDHQTDEHLKAVAELQMRKLNRIYGVLSDPIRRRKYDDLLEEQPGPSTPLISERLRKLRTSRVAGLLTWVAAVLVVVALLSWLASESPIQIGSGSVAGMAETGAAATDLASELARTRAELKSVQFQRDAAVRELGKLQGNPVVLPDPPVEARAEGDGGKKRTLGPVPAGAATELPSAPLSNAPPATLNASVPRNTRYTRVPARALTGFWFYTRNREEKRESGLYPPEFVEARIAEKDGVVQGRYRSRYRILDRAISPDVNFEFTGKLKENVVTASWVGAGGAHGEMTIKMVSDNTMRVDWTADQLGSVQGLTAGTAALTRRLD